MRAQEVVVSRPAGALTQQVRRLWAPNWSLGWVGAVTLLIYLGFAWRFSLLANVERPLLDMGRMTDHQPGAAGAIFLAFLALFAAYWVGYQHLRSSAPSPDAWKLVVGGATVFNLVLLLMYPVGAADVFDNIVRGRMTAFYHANPFAQVPGQFPGDPFVRYAAWAGFRSAYGPLWESIAAAMAWLAGNDILGNVLVFKLGMVLAYVADTVLIWRILARIAPRRAPSGVYLFAWNPLVLFETAGNAHNDSLMLLTILLAVFLYVNQQHTAAVVALTAGALIKFFPAVLVPLFVAGSLRRLERRQRWISLLRSVVLSLALVALFYVPFRGSSDPLNLTHRDALFTTSIPALAQVVLVPRVGGETAGRVVNLAAAAVLGVFVLYQAWRLDSGNRALPGAVYGVVIFYLLVTCPWLQPWYVVWAVGLVALLDDAALVWGALLLAFTLTWKYLLYAFFFGAQKPLMPRPPRELLAFSVVTLLPLLYHVRTVWVRWQGVRHASPGYHPHLQ
jgi:alpha-1,6-mannosyltransferase